MRAPYRVGCWAAVAAAGLAGCHTTGSAPASSSAFAPPAAPQLPATQPGSLESDWKTLPAADPLADAVPPASLPGTTYRALTEDNCRAFAAAHAPAAGLIEREGDVPAVPPATRREARRTPPATCDELARELRIYAAADARNAAAADALEQFFRLADAEGRSALLRATVPLLDETRAKVKAARAEGLRVPADPDELDRQRAQVLGLIGQADLGVALLNIDLKRRIGLPSHDADRLWPAGPFPVSADPIDGEGAVQTALERRPDLQLLRAAYLRLTPETLPAVRDLLRTYGGKGAGLGGPPAGNGADRAGGHHGRTATAVEAAALAELEVRRQQLFDLTAARERQAADEVRAAAATLTAQTRQVALTRWRAEQAAAKVADARKQGPLAELPAAVEAVRARAEVVAAVFAWHQARAKLLGAQGLLAGPPGP